MATTTENRRIYIYVNDKMIENNMRSIRKAYYKTNAELEKMDRSAKGYNQKVKELQRLGGIMTEHRNKVRGVSQAYNRMKELMFAVVGGNLITSGLMAIQNGFTKAFDSVYKLSDAQADVRKTTNLTEEAFSKLENELRKINKTTRTSRLELYKLAEEGGRLGYKTVDDITKFVKVADQLKVALGDDLGGETAIRDVGKLTQTFMVAEREGYDLEKSLLAVGSVINELSASGSVQANYLVDFTSRLSGTAVQAKITETNVMGLAAVLDEAGQKVEMSGTALTQTILDMFKNTEYYAKIAGLSVSEYTNILNTDANEALLLFLEGLKGNNTGLTEMSAKLDALGVDGVRATSVLATLANQTDKVREKQKLANEAFKEGSSLTKEFNLRNNNLAGTWDKIQKQLGAIFYNPTLIKGMENMINWLGKVTGAILPQSDALRQEIIQLNVMQSKINDVNTKQEDRLNLINELQEKYPDFLANINAEKVSNEQLNDVLKDVNSQLIKKYTLALKDDKVIEATKKAGEAALEYQESLENLITTIARLKLETPEFKEDPLKTPMENAFALRDILEDKAVNGSIFNDDISRSSDLSAAMARLKKAQIESNELEKEALKLTEQRKKLADELFPQGEEESNKSNKNNTVTITPTTTPTNELKSKIKTIVQAFSDTLDEETKQKLPDFEKTWSDLFTESIGADEVVSDLNNKLDAQFDNFINAHNEIDWSLTSDTDVWIEQMRGYYKNLLLLAEEYGYKVEEIQKEQNDFEVHAKAVKLQEQVAEYAMYAQNVQNLASSISSFIAQKENEELQNATIINQRKHEVLKQRLDSDFITQRQYEIEKQRLDDELQRKENELKKQAFNRDKALKLTQAIINGALATTQALAAPVPPPGNFILAGLVGAAAGVEIAAIGAQKPPKFKFGGTITDGPSHQMGGMPLFDPRTGRVVAELEGGEPVLSKKFAENNPEFTAAALQASKTGARLNIPFLGAQPQPSRKFAKGGYVPSTSIGSAQVGNNMVLDTSNMEAEFRAMRKEFSQFKTIRAQVSLTELLDAEDEYNQIKSIDDMN